MSSTSKYSKFLDSQFLFFLASWFIVSLLIISYEQFSSYRSRDRIFNYQEGSTAKEDFIIGYDFSFIDEEATDKLINLNMSLINPVYIIRDEVTQSVLNRFDDFRDAFLAFQLGVITDTSLEDFTRQYPAFLAISNQGELQDIEILKNILNQTRDILFDIQHTGIFQLKHEFDEPDTGIVEVIHSEDETKLRATRIRENLTQIENLSTILNNYFVNSDMDTEFKEIASALILFFAQPNTYFSPSLTEENFNNALESIKPVTISIKAGTKILNAQEVVSAKQAKILQVLRKNQGVSFREIIEPFLYMGLIILLGYICTKIFNITFKKLRFFWFYLILWVVFLFILFILDTILKLSGSFNISLFLPIALINVFILQILLDTKLGILTTLIMALIILFFQSGDISGFLITLTSGIAGILAVKKDESGINLLKVGPRLAILMAVFTIVSTYLISDDIKTSLISGLWSASNGLLSGILNLFLLPALSHYLNASTSIRLIYLSDQNIPILKKMRLQAPGTYIHSQNVAQLAESACDAIGANGLLARVGAYYHDIGKTDQAHFFVENQSGQNKHDELKTSLSVAVIKSHVKIGMEKGREIRLPDEVMDIIAQHHGTSVIQYFYDRALKENNNNASIEDYSYAGPKPQSQEAAIVMLADSAEAAGRALKKPTKTKLDKCIGDIILERLNKGELNESNLTLNDLEIIKNTFVHVLTGFYHVRLEYPKTTENNNESN